LFLQSKIQQFSNDNAGLIPVKACLDLFMRKNEDFPSLLFSAVESKWLLNKFLTEKFGMMMPKKIPLRKSHV